MDEQQVVPVEAAVPAQEVVQAPQDPFSLEESSLASLSPEQRAALDPVFDNWKKKALDEISTKEKTYQEKYKPAEEKATALDNLVRDPRFQQWWTSLQTSAMQGQNQQTQNQVAQSKPQDFASPEEWQQAVLDASNGSSDKMREIQARMFNSMAAPVVQELRAQQQELQTTMAMKDLLERHPDARQLDMIGRNGASDTNPSLLEIAMYYAVDQNKGSLEDGYSLARRWADSMSKNAQQQAMGLVQDKKGSVTAGPSTSAGGQTVVEVASADELIQKNMEALLAGVKPPKYVIRAGK